MNNISKKWGKFLEVILSPGSVIFSILTILSLVFAYHFKQNILFSTLLSIIGSVFAGIAGSLFKDDYDQLMGKNILEKKGRSALRNIESIEKQIVQIRKWLPSFKDIGKEGKKALAEIDRHLSTAQLNISSGLADWIDIVPELKANIQQRAEIDKQYVEIIQSSVKELWDKRKELASSKDQKQEEELKKKISELEKQIKEIQKERSRIVGGTAGGLITATGIGFGGSLSALSGENNGQILWSGSSILPWQQKCSNCGIVFDSDPRVTNLSGRNLCSECKKITP